MDFKEMYAQKKMTAEQAAALVKSGDWVDYGWCVNTPVAVDAALAKRLPELENVNFRGGILMWVPEIFQIDCCPHDLEQLAYGRHRAQGHRTGLFVLLPHPVF